MSLSPPQFIKMLRSRDRASLVTDLQSLAENWEERATDPNDPWCGGLRLCTKELRQVLDLHE